MDLTATRKQLAEMGPGLLLESDEAHMVIADAFMPDGETLLCFDLDPEARFLQYKVSQVSAEGKGLVFDSPERIYLALYPLPDYIDPAIREDAATSVMAATRTQESIEVLYQDLGAK